MGLKRVEITENKSMIFDNFTVGSIVLQVINGSLPFTASFSLLAFHTTPGAILAPFSPPPPKMVYSSSPLSHSGSSILAAGAMAEPRC